MIVTERRVEVKVCPNSGREAAAPFPPDVIAPTPYSLRFNAWLVYLRVQQLIPLERIARMAHDFFGATVSQATIHNAVSTAYRALDAFETTVAGLLSRASVAHADETGLRVAGQLHWLHVAGTKLLTWHGVSRRRGRDAVKRFALLTKFSGRLVHDCLSAYFQLNCLHGLRSARLLREFVFLFEVQRQPWAKSMFRLLIRMHRAVQSQKERAGPLAAVQLAAWSAKYRAVLRQGFAENPILAPPGPRRRGRPKHTKAQNLLLRLQEHERSVLAFLHDSNAPFTNRPSATCA